jgi:hypothetical protein
MRLTESMPKCRVGLGHRAWVGLLVAGLCAAGLGTHAEAQDATALVQQAVNAELAASRDDHTHWKYTQRESNGDVFTVVETKDGSVKRHVMEHGQPASAATLAADDAYNERFAHDPALQAKQRRDGQHDDKSATELLRQMPQAFVWKIEGETADGTSLSYTPNPDFDPPSMESRVMSAMAGTMVVSKPGNRIRTFKGRLNEDVTIGFGFLARIKSGSTFDVERREIAPGLWQITETHVHIQGHALFFKTIGEQQDEINSDFSQVPADTTLEQAVAMLRQGAASTPACCSAK